MEVTLEQALALIAERAAKGGGKKKRKRKRPPKPKAPKARRAKRKSPQRRKESRGEKESAGEGEEKAGARGGRIIAAPAPRTRRRSTRPACLPCWPNIPAPPSAIWRALTGLKGSDRIVLKRLLRELEAEGAIDGKAKRGLTKAGELPEIAVLEITGTDSRRRIAGAPLTWESNKEPPPINVVPPKDGAAPGDGAAHPGAAWRSGGEGYEAAVMRRLESETGPERILGVLRENGAGFRVLPVDRKARSEYALDRATRRARRTTNWCCASLSAANPRAFPASAWWSASAAWTARAPSA